MQKNRKKKGFTLVELLAVIVILGIVIAVVSGIYTNVLKNILEKDYENLVSYIESQAAKYAEETGITTVTVEELIVAGYISPDDTTDIYNPVDKTSLNCYIVTSKFINGSYESALGNNISRDEFGKCNAYEKTGKYEIRALSGGSWVEISDDKWLKATELTIGVTTHDGTLISNEEYDVDWHSNAGASGTGNTMVVKTKDVLQSTYQADVIKKDDAKDIGYAKKTIRLDNHAPVLVEKKYDNNWTNVNKELEIIASDNLESGMSGIYVGTKKCSELTESNFTPAPDGKHKFSLDRGTYNICLIDKVKNVSNNDEYEVTIDRIDKNLPINLRIGKSTNDYVLSLNLTGYARDEDSGIIGYQFTQSNDKPSSGWTNIKNTHDLTSTPYPVTKNGRYYFWVIDAAGNITSTYIDVQNIGILKTVSFNLSQEGSSTISHSEYLADIKRIDKIVTDNGQVIQSNLSGSTVSFTVSNGTAKTGVTLETITVPSNSRLANNVSDRVCTCSDGIFSGGACVPSNGVYSYPHTGNTHTRTCKCQNGTYQCYGSSYTPCRVSGYERHSNEEVNIVGSIHGQSCSGSDSVEESVYGETTCYWSNPTPRCSTDHHYECNYGEVLFGNMCYYCNRGNFGRDRRTCVYDEYTPYYYWEYNVTVTYVTDK